MGERGRKGRERTMSQVVSLLILQRMRMESGWLLWTTLAMQTMRGSWLDVLERKTMKTSGLPVDPVVIINNATVIATLVYLTTCCNCNGHNLLGTTIAGVMIKMNAKNGDWTCNLSSNMVI